MGPSIISSMLILFLYIIYASYPLHKSSDDSGLVLLAIAGYHA